MQFHEKFYDLIEFTSFFAWTFLNFVARCVLLDHFTCIKLAVVINFDAPSVTSFHNATFLSGIFQSLSLPSRLPDKKN